MPNWFEGCRKLLVRAPNWLGDVVMCLPALAAARRAAPGMHLTLALPAHLAELFSAARDVDAVLPVRRGAGGLGAMLTLAADYRRGAFDSALLLPNSFGSALASWLARVPRCAGYARDGRSWMLGERVPCDARRRALHQVEYYLQLVEALGADAGGFDRSRPVRLDAPEAARKQVAEVLAAERRRPGAPLVVLAPCAIGAGKEWAPERFGRLAGRLWQSGREVALVGSPAERAKTAAVAAAARAAGGEVIDLAGRNSVAQMAALFETADGFAGNDSGPMHLAGALGLAAVGVFVGTDPALYRPLGPRIAVVGGPGQDPQPEAVLAALDGLMGGGERGAGSGKRESAAPARTPDPAIDREVRP
ncbi:MAG TPA: glycosyltransferase family 9 protein [Planctomycetota bacterium]|nr:glycosyltransferase family 9 protein [Planctomycetota bacterium]